MPTLIPTLSNNKKFRGDFPGIVLKITGIFSYGADIRTEGQVKAITAQELEIAKNSFTTSGNF